MRRTVAGCGWLSETLPVIAAIVGAIAGGSIGFVTARYSTYRTARAAAASKLRAAFALEIVRMKFERKTLHFRADEVLQAAFYRHAEVIEEFRFYVKPKKWEEYERAWTEYADREVNSGLRRGAPFAGRAAELCVRERTRTVERQGAERTGRG